VRRALEPIVKKLDRAQTGLLRAADAVTAEQWKTCPCEGVWSAGELVAHLIMVERRVIGSADKYLQKPPNEVPLLKRFHVPMAVVAARLIRRKSPNPPEPGLMREKEEMLAELREVRGRTLAFLDEMRQRDLSKYRWPHPFIGSLNAYDWMCFIAAHEIRHTKQMQEIAANLLKVVGSLQK
jgi:uncharacterized damage-inducible protein DinB